MYTYTYAYIYIYVLAIFCALQRTRTANLIVTNFKFPVNFYQITGPPVREARNLSVHVLSLQFWQSIRTQFCVSFHAGALYYTYSFHFMGWLQLVGSWKLYFSCEKDPYKRDYILPNRPIILRSLLIVATSYTIIRIMECASYKGFVWWNAPEKGQYIEISLHSPFSGTFHYTTPLSLQWYEVATISRLLKIIETHAVFRINRNPGLGI